VLLAEEERDIRSLIERLEIYLSGKGLELNVENTKIVRFKRGGRTLNKVNWSWKGSRIEEMREYKYLGYKMQTNGGQESCKGKNSQNGSDNGAGMGNWKKEIWKGLEKEDVAVR